MTMVIPDMKSPRSPCLLPPGEGQNEEALDQSVSLSIPLTPTPPEGSECIWDSSGTNLFGVPFIFDCSNLCPPGTNHVRHCGASRNPAMNKGFAL
jgi:hypothetical protein